MNTLYKLIMYFVHTMDCEAYEEYDEVETRININFKFVQGNGLGGGGGGGGGHHHDSSDPLAWLRESVPGEVERYIAI